MYIYTLVPRRSAPLCLANPAYRHVFTKNGFPYYHFTSLTRQPRCRHPPREIQFKTLIKSFNSPPTIRHA